MDFSQYVEGNALLLSPYDIIGGKDVSELVNFLKKNLHITEISLCSCSISDENAEELAQVNLTHLTSFTLYSIGASVELFDRIGNKGIS